MFFSVCVSAQQCAQKNSSWCQRKSIKHISLNLNMFCFCPGLHCSIVLQNYLYNLFDHTWHVTWLTIIEIQYVYTFKYFFCWCFMMELQYKSFLVLYWEAKVPLWDRHYHIFHYCLLRAGFLLTPSSFSSSSPVVSWQTDSVETSRRWLPRSRIMQLVRDLKFSIIF